MEEIAKPVSEDWERIYSLNRAWKPGYKSTGRERERESDLMDITACVPERIGNIRYDRSILARLTRVARNEAM